MEEEGNSYYFKLSKGKKSFCPDCEQQTFSVYIDADDKMINKNCGRCDRQNNCTYHLPPSEYFLLSPEERNKPRTPIQEKPKRPPDFISMQKVIESRPLVVETSFYKELHYTFDAQAVVTASRDYLLGGHGNDSIFWQIDIDNRVRTGRVIPYIGLSRNKQRHDGWAHSSYMGYTDIHDYSLHQVPFGLHLIKKYPGKKICVTEACKTAVICSIAMPDCVWIAVGSLEMLSLLDGSPGQYLIYPDKGKSFDIWKEKLEKMDIRYRLMQFMENTNYPNGSDLADYVIDQNKKPIDFD